MLKVFGIANHGPEAVVTALVKAKRASLSDIAIVPVDYRLSVKRPTNQKFLLFLSVKDLMRNQEALHHDKYSGSVCLVFANPMKLTEIVGICALDFEPIPEQAGFGFMLKTLDLAKLRQYKGCAELIYKNGKYLAKLVDHVQKGSLLNAFMTFVYTLPSATQAAVKTVALNWLYLGKSTSSLDKAFDSLDISVTTRVRSKFKDILITDIGKSFQQAFKLYRESDRSDDSVIRIAKLCGVSDYEMRYILSIVENKKQSDLFVDSFDKAKNRKTKVKKL